MWSIRGVWILRIKKSKKNVSLRFEILERLRAFYTKRYISCLCFTSKLSVWVNKLCLKVLNCIYIFFYALWYRMAHTQALVVFLAPCLFMLNVACAWDHAYVISMGRVLLRAGWCGWKDLHLTLHLFTDAQVAHKHWAAINYYSILLWFFIYREHFFFFELISQIWITCGFRQKCKKK